MNYVQRKLTDSEWKNLEIKVEKDDFNVLNVIHDGYNDHTISYMPHDYMSKIIKIDDKNYEYHIFELFILPKLQGLKFQDSQLNEIYHELLKSKHEKVRTKEMKKLTK